MKAPSARQTRKTADLALEPTDRLSAAREVGEASMKVAADPPEATELRGDLNGAVHPAAAPRVGRSRQKKKTLNGHAAAAENGHMSAARLAEFQTKLAQAETQIATLEASEKRLGAELSRITDGQSAQARSLERSLAALGDELGNILAERSVAELRAEAAAQKLENATSELAQLASKLEGARTDAAELRGERQQQAITQAQLERALASATARLAEISEERERLKAEVAQLRGLLDRQATEWRAERGELAAGLAEAKARAAQLGTQAGWADEQIAILVEKEAASGRELVRREREGEVLTRRSEALQAELAAVQAALGQRDDLQLELTARAQRLVGELPSCGSLLEALEAIRQRMRVLERDLDRSEVARQTALSQLRLRQRSSYAMLLRGAHRIQRSCTPVVQRIFGSKRRPLQYAHSRTQPDDDSIH